MNNNDMMIIQALSQDIQQMQQRRDFFEGIMLQLLVGLKDAGIIVEEEDGEEESAVLTSSD